MPDTDPLKSTFDLTLLETFTFPTSQWRDTCWTTDASYARFGLTRLANGTSEVRRMRRRGHKTQGQQGKHKGSRAPAGQVRHRSTPQACSVQIRSGDWLAWISSGYSRSSALSQAFDAPSSELKPGQGHHSAPTLNFRSGCSKYDKQGSTHSSPIFSHQQLAKDKRRPHANLHLSAPPNPLSCLPISSRRSRHRAQSVGVAR